MDRPTEYPEWASNPPVAPPTTITDPTLLQKQQGFQPGNAVRQFMNWLLNTLFRWIVWGDQTNHRTSDMHPNHALPMGTLPSIGAGLVINAADFAGRVYANGYEVPLTSGPTLVAPAITFTYPVNSDTYWDLRQDTSWIASSVAHLAAAPAVPANSTRVYMVTTNGVDRTAVTDFRESRVRLNQALGFEGALQVGPQLASGYPTAVDQLTRGVTYHLVPASGIVYQLLKYYFPDSAGFVGARLYIQNLGAPNNFVKFSLVWGADYAPSVWTARASNAFRIDFCPATNAQGLRYSRISGLTPNVSTFLDTEWQNETLASATRRQLPFGGGLRLGADLNTAGGPDVNITPPIEWVRGNGAERYTLITHNRFAAEANVTEYLSTTGPTNGGTPYGTCRVLAHNCIWDQGNGLWARTIAGIAYLQIICPLGEYFFAHLAAGPATWTDTVDNSVNTVWQNSIAKTSTSLFARNLFTDQAAVAPSANAIYSPNVAKAAGTVQCNGAGGFAFGNTGLNYTASIPGTNDRVRLTLTTPMNGTHWGLTFGPTVRGWGLVYNVVSATVVDVFTYNISTLASIDPTVLTGGNVVEFTFQVVGLQ